MLLKIGFAIQMNKFLECPGMRWKNVRNILKLNVRKGCEKPSIEIEIESEFNPAKLYSNLLLKNYLGLQICQFLFALFLLPKNNPPSLSPFLLLPYSS